MRREVSVAEYVDGVRGKSRAMLARAITLIESTHARHMQMAQEVVHALLPSAGNSIRIGITGVPGAGKSTFIDTFGTYLCDRGHRVAVLAIDPTSVRTRGSILGDKTRMERLSRNDRCFIRPSPSGGNLGGVARKTRESIVLCEAAGFDVIIVETVGVGQSEGTVRSMVDFFLLLTITGAGDELQAFKKGVMELADAIVVNKADGDNEQAAKELVSEFNHVLRHIPHGTKGWKTKASPCSARTGYNVDKVWEMISQFKEETSQSGELPRRRREQQVEWLESLVLEALKDSFLSHPLIKERYSITRDEVASGSKSAVSATEELLQLYRGMERELC